MFLAVANSREAELQLSVIYRWQRRRRRFVQHQTLQTHSAVDWEAFSIQQQHFLVVANHRRGEPWWAGLRLWLTRVGGGGEVM